MFRLAGLTEVIEQEGAEFFDHNRPPFTSVDLDYGEDREVRGSQRSVMVNPRVLGYETLVALNQLKLHRTATVTLALKNIAMSYPAADYYGHPRSEKEHEHCFYNDLHSFIAAMAKRFPVSLAITVGHPAMIATGPTGSTLRFVELPSRLEQFDRIAVWVFHLYLPAGRADFHFIAEVSSRLRQRLDKSRKVFHPQHHAVPSARFLLPPVRHWA